MTEAQTAIVVASIGLLGTLAGVVIGYRKWRRQESRERFGEFEREVQSTYKELWSRVEGLNVGTRIEEVDDEEFSRQRQELNAFMLKAGIYLEDEDRALANEYLEAVRAFQAAVRESDSAEAVRELGRTEDIPREVVEAAREIGDTQQRALELRARLIARVREVLGGQGG